MRALRRVHSGAVGSFGTTAAACTSLACPARPTSHAHFISRRCARGLGSVAPSFLRRRAAGSLLPLRASVSSFPLTFLRGGPSLRAVFRPVRLTLAQLRALSSESTPLSNESARDSPRLPGAASSAGDLDADEVAIDLRERAASLGVRLTALEALHVASESVQHNQHIHLTRRKFLKYAHQQSDRDLERDALLAAIEQPAAEGSIIGKYALPAVNVVGSISFAIAGTQVAGEAGMNIIGCTLVGCVTAVGGGTVNSLLFGAAKNGVPWVIDPLYLFIALSTSIATFFAWPEICRVMAERKLRQMHAAASTSKWWEAPYQYVSLFGLNSADCITKQQFALACRDPELYRSAVAALAPHATAPPPAEILFDKLDGDANGRLELSELQKMVQLEYDGSKLRYMLDTIALGAASVDAAAGAITRGLHPVVCMVSGVTICSGGIIRDLLCKRDVGLCSQSYAASTAAGAFVYIALRELCLRGVSFLPLSVRVLLSCSTTIGVRLADYYQEDGLLRPMHGKPP